MEGIAYRMGMPVPAVRGAFALRDRLVADHGDEWRQYYLDGVLAALRSGEDWARDVLFALVGPSVDAMVDTVTLAEQVNGDPGLAVQHTMGLSKETAVWCVNLVKKTGGRS
ncbi:hypothetical protein GCM10010390_65600 [Streptomyces mordarskii]|uniref:Uncharacterized protein n=2 Tax=Streptomyces TaxID=1883 RepID=A0ABN1DWU5_9ACTN